MNFKERLKRAAEKAKVPWSQTAVGKSLGLNRQTVDRWFAEGQPKPAQLFLIADRWQVSARWLATGEGGMVDLGNTPLEAKEELLLEHWRGLVESQQRELFKEIRALYNANALIKKQLNGSTLRVVGNEEVEAAFGKVPAPTKKRAPIAPKRDPEDPV